MLATLKAFITRLRIVGFFTGTDKALDSAHTGPKPEHVAVIMDGNGRWANSQGLTRVAGHKRGVDAVKNLIKSCIKNEIKVLSLFAFSSENWNRPEAEVQALMDLLSNALDTQTKKLHDHGVRLRILGDLSRFNHQIQAQAQQAEAMTADNSTLQLNVAINYGGRWDIVQATRAIADKVQHGKISVAQIDEDLFEQHLVTADLIKPDLLIRTSGEYRISNFFLWQTAYSEFYFSDILWPDFDEQAFSQALSSYTNRDRRFGKATDVPNSAVNPVREAQSSEAAGKSIASGRAA